MTTSATTVATVAASGRACAAWTQAKAEQAGREHREEHHSGHDQQGHPGAVDGPLEGEHRPVAKGGSETARAAAGGARHVARAAGAGVERDQRYEGDDGDSGGCEARPPPRRGGQERERDEAGGKDDHAAAVGPEVAGRPLRRATSASTSHAAGQPRAATQQGRRGEGGHHEHGREQVGEPVEAGVLGGAQGREGDDRRIDAERGKVAGDDGGEGDAERER